MSKVDAASESSLMTDSSYREETFGYTERYLNVAGAQWNVEVIICLREYPCVSIMIDPV